jgi:hypothetical protein
MEPMRFILYGNVYAQLGDETTTRKITPRRVFASGALAVASGGWLIAGAS